jgi:hypothetical protein
MVLCSSCDGVHLQIQKEKRASLQSTITDYLSIILIPVRIHWTMPLKGNSTGLEAVSGSHISLRALRRWWGGGPPLCIGQYEVGTYIYSLLYTYTGLLGRLLMKFNSR